MYLVNPLGGVGLFHMIQNCIYLNCFMGMSIFVKTILANGQAADQGTVKVGKTKNNKILQA